MMNKLDLIYVGREKGQEDLKDWKILCPVWRNRSNALICLIPLPDHRSSPPHWRHISPRPHRYLGAFLPGGLQAVLPHSDQLHVRGGEAVPPCPAGLHRLPVAAARRGRDRDPPVVRRPVAAQRAGAAAGSAHPHRAARQRQGTTAASALRIR